MFSYPTKKLARGGYPVLMFTIVGAFYLILSSEFITLLQAIIHYSFIMLAVIDLSNDGMAASIQRPNSELIQAANDANISLIVKIVDAGAKELILQRQLPRPINWNGMYTPIFFVF